MKLENQADYDDRLDERRHYEAPTQAESNLTVKLGAIVIIILGIFGFFFVTILSHGERLTKVETLATVSLSNIEKNLDKISTSFEDHRKESQNRQDENRKKYE